MRREQIFEYWQGRPLKFRVVISFLVIAFGIIAFLIGIILGYVEPGENFFLALTNTLLAAGITLLVYAFISFLEKPEKELEIPDIFYTAAQKQVSRTLFYRTDCKVNFVVENNEFHFNSYSSLIQIHQQGSARPTIPYPSGEIPKNLKLIKGPVYYRDGIGQPKNKPIEIGREERVKIEYEIIGGEIGDTHNWKSPVHGFELKAQLPHGSTMEVFALSSSSSGYGEESIDNSYPKEGGWLFRYDRPLFPHQGFRWKIILPSDSC